MDRKSLNHFVLLLLLKVPIPGHLVKVLYDEAGGAVEAMQMEQTKPASFGAFFEDTKLWTGRGYGTCVSFYTIHILFVQAPEVSIGFFLFHFLGRPLCSGLSSHPFEERNHYRTGFNEYQVTSCI